MPMPNTKPRKWGGAKFTAKLLLFFCLIFIFAGQTQAAANMNASKDISYVIKLRNQNGLKLVGSIGRDINRRFIFSSNPEFANVYSFQSPYPLADLQQLLSGKYDYLELDKQYAAQTVYVNDPGFTLNVQDIDKEWGLAKAGFPEAWDKTTGSVKNVVAVIDTGIDATHQDLQSIKFVGGFDFTAKQPINGNINSDDNGHGTLVAGVLGAAANNNIGVAGTNWDISIMPLKALDASGKGDSASIAEAVVWAADHGANFINLSVGGIGFGHDTALANSISYAYNRNVLIVAAAGNDMEATGTSLDSEPVYPICDDNNANMIIGVAATDQNDLKPAFSNYGKNCIDVTAPGKRILSTINFDPLTKKPSPNSYAYASGTSLAVPFVVGQAALIKSLYPNATNVQIRDRIIATADPVDNLNLTQCGNASCRGLLGSGRINVPKSLQDEIPGQNLAEGELVKNSSTGAVYQILGGQKRLVSPFVLNQKFPGASITVVSSRNLETYPEGSYVTPEDGTLVKWAADPTVYMVSKGQKLPITYQIFMQRRLNFQDVSIASFGEINSWTTGNFLPPSEGSLAKSANNPTVYWVVGGVLHPVNAEFYKQRGLNLFPIFNVSPQDLENFPKGEAYIR
ncbi:MAG: S8 family serine peptidase [Patescibacteria group bacterium]|nr:S8 family serine peptidase [Patescibacteria group bacterium]